MISQLEKIKSNIAVLERFAYKYPLDLPENLVDISLHALKIDVNAGYAPNEHGRLKILATVGEVFGREGWTATEDDYHNIHWTREFVLDEHTTVNVRIYNAEKVPRAQPMPVPVQKFPIMLENYVDVEVKETPDPLF